MEQLTFHISLHASITASGSGMCLIKIHNDLAVAHASRVQQRCDTVLAGQRLLLTAAARHLRGCAGHQQVQAQHFCFVFAFLLALECEFQPTSLHSLCIAPESFRRVVHSAMQGVHKAYQARHAGIRAAQLVLFTGERCCDFCSQAVPAASNLCSRDPRTDCKTLQLLTPSC